MKTQHFRFFFFFFFFGEKLRPHDRVAGTFSKTHSHFSTFLISVIPLPHHILSFTDRNCTEKEIFHFNNTTENLRPHDRVAGTFNNTFSDSSTFLTAAMPLPRPILSFSDRIRTEKEILHFKNKTKPPATRSCGRNLYQNA
jgi:phosphopantetheinyl transferase (holo-ACP synthase)